jgi:hypothetical protein
MGVAQKLYFISEPGEILLYFATPFVHSLLGVAILKKFRLRSRSPFYAFSKVATAYFSSISNR